jgi:hypothetical protein
MLYPDPSAPVIGVGYPRLRALEGADGKALPVGPVAFQSDPETVRSGTIGLYRTVFLNLPEKVEGPLKRLEAIVPFVVEVRRREKVVVAGLAGAASRALPIPGGGRLVVQVRRTPGAFTNVEVRVDTAGLWDIDPRRHAVELVDDNGVRHRGGAFSPFSVPAGFAPESLLVVGHPLVNLAWQARLQAPTVRGRVVLSIPPTVVIGTQSRLVFYEADRLRTEATFELRDLPLR